MTSRGCPARCTFCNVSGFYGNSLRSRSLDSMIKELDIVVEQGYKEIWYRDETFTFFKERNKKFCDHIRKNKIDLTWIANARVGTVDKEDMIMLKKAGCHMLKFGIESGVQEILDNVKKGTTIDMARKTFKWAHETGMETHAHMMLGMPGDSKETVKQTIKFVKQIEPTTVTFGICTPYPGTPLFESVEKQDPSVRDGKELNLKKIHTTGAFNKYYTSLNDKELQEYLKSAYRSFYFRPSYILKRLKTMKSIEEVKRTVRAGMNVFQFGMDRED
ncbi:MAG: radical SAM protein [Candidatus Aenigmarchaeota archaeon]|nr:radical SAM protein [Candidatus Aenigmarchaeota archaeon]